MNLSIAFKPKSRLGKWSVSLTITFIIILALSITATLFGLGYLEPNRAVMITFIVIITTLAILGMGSIITGIIAIKKKTEKSILVFISVFVAIIGLVSICLVFWGNPSNVSEEKIIMYFLTSDIMDGRYHVYDPEMSLHFLDEGYEDSIRNQLSQEGYDFNTLVTTFFEKNRKPVRISIPSSPESGYYIDYDGRFVSYFEKDGGGWSLLRQENPDARAFVQLSVPAYDSSTGLIMIYIGWLGDSLFGEGTIDIYKYAFGQLIPVTSIFLWMS